MNNDKWCDNSLKLNCTSATMGVKKIRKSKDDIKVPVGNMPLSVVSVFLSKTEVNDIHLQKRRI